MADVSNYISDVQRRRERRRRYFLVGSIVGSVYIAGLGVAWLLFWSPLLKFETIAVAADDLSPRWTSDEQIIELLTGPVFSSGGRHWLSLGNFMAWPDSVSDKDIAFFPQLKSVSIEKKILSNVLMAHIRERKPFGIWCFRTTAPAECFWFDTGGVIFERMVAAEGNLL